VHVRQQRRAGIEQEPTVDDDRPVVPLQRERCAGAEKGEPQAIVTALLR